MKSVAAFLVLVFIWLAGLLAFAGRIAQETPAAEPDRADGVVALTGLNSNERIAAGVTLLENGYGKRMLVSGVNREASREDIRNVSKAVKRLYDCCVDLGFTAADTVGNARETAGWAKAMGFKSLIVVTADYHMPRAMLELRAVTRDPAIALQAYPVATPAVNAKRWWRSPGAVRLLTVEYSKYLAILIRDMVLSLGPKEKPHH
jgi:uncharacterized SAM-binding protein YcdF (DUF218 family)